MFEPQIRRTWTTARTSVLIAAVAAAADAVMAVVAVIQLVLSFH